MFRPIQLKEENIYELVLMKNRREELVEIPLEYIVDITFAMGEYMSEPTTINLSIPSHIERNGEVTELPLYSLIKGKMQLVLTMNNSRKFTFSIEEEDIAETENFSTKNMVAYERQYKLNKTDFTLSSTVATRQLYKKVDEKVETSDGILNWFEEQCTGWKVGEITDKARKELTLCSSTNHIELGKIDKTITSEIFNVNAPIDIGEKPLNLTLTMECTVLDENGREYLTSTLPFKFNNLPYAVKSIKANYVSTGKNFYGIEFTITHGNNYTTKKEFAFLNCKNLRLKSGLSITYELGDLVENWVTKYRSFEATSCSWMTMLETIAQSFDCIIIFDSYNQTINVCHREEFGEKTNVALTYDNALQEISKERNLDDVVTRLWVESSNTTIASVNILGTDYIECFDYFVDNNIMSSELQQALVNYNELLKQKDIEFNGLIIEKHNRDQEFTLASSQLVSLQGKYSAENAILTGIIKSATSSDSANGEDGIAWADKQKAQQIIVADLEVQINVMLGKVDRLKEESSKLETKMTEIGIQIKKENATLNGVLIFDSDLLLELSDYVIEQTLSDDVRLTAYALYDYAKERIEELQKPIVDFTIKTSMEFIKRTGMQICDYVFLGAKMEIEDKAGELADEDGTVMLYGFKLNPKIDEVTDLTFTNSAKVPESAIKTISKTTQTVSSTKGLTDFYKSTLQDMKSNSYDVSKILNDGLDLASQKVRSRTETNILEIDEAGIFLIDATDNNNQLALINDLIAMTTDRWKTSKIAISPEGIMAEQLIGKIIIGEDLFLGNGNNTFKITKDGNAYGMFMYSMKQDASFLRMFLGINKNGKPRLELFDEADFDFQNENDEARKKALRVFLGVDSDNLAKLKLYSRTGDNGLVLSEEGIYNCYQVSDRDSFDYNNSFKSYFHIPNTLKNTFEAKLIVQLQPFRAYSKASESTKIELDTTNGSGTINVSMSGVTSGSNDVNVTGSGTVNSTTGDAWSNGGRQTSTPSGSSNDDQTNIDMNSHTHWVKLIHNHGISVNCGQHKHAITLTGSANANDHKHSITMPSHEHGLVYGIYENKSIPQCKVYMSGREVATLNSSTTYLEIDVTNMFGQLAKGSNTIEFRTTNTSGLARASFTLFWSGYYNYN